MYEVTTKHFQYMNTAGFWQRKSEFQILRRISHLEDEKNYDELNGCKGEEKEEAVE